MFTTPDLRRPLGNGVGGSDSDCKLIRCGLGTANIESKLIIPVGLASAGLSMFLMQKKGCRDIQVRSAWSLFGFIQGLLVRALCSMKVASMFVNLRWFYNGYNHINTALRSEIERMDPNWLCICGTINTNTD